jgi:hypothetical protein
MSMDSRCPGSGTSASSNGHARCLCRSQIRIWWTGILRANFLSEKRYPRVMRLESDRDVSRGR